MTQKKKGHIMNDVTTPTAEMQPTTTDDQIQGDHQKLTPEALETTVKRLIARKSSIEEMQEPRAIIKLRKKLDEGKVNVQQHIESLKKLGISEDPLEAFEGNSEKKRWKSHFENLEKNQKLLLKRVIVLNKENTDSE
jgi:hypothetical protein